MSTQAGFDLNLNASDYVQSAGQALATTTALDNALAKLSVTAGLTGRGWGQSVPSRQHLAALGGFTAAAAAQEQTLQGLNATQAVTGQRADQLARGIRQLARDMPVGQSATQQTVQTIQQLGVAAAGQERKVIGLSKVVTQLGGATGGFAPQMAQGLTQLERTFGDRGLDVKKVRDTSDALVTVSKNAGASAQGTLDFANAIGPMAQSAGIGKAASLGIGAAFSRIGQDGTSAATAVNKMLSDMSKAVRDGGPEMATYANIVGTTADQFERLFKSNPAEALQKVTEAIGKDPTQGPRILENLGLEGVRTQRALQAVSASGGLRDQINSAIGGQGNDATRKASEAAFKGVIDDFQRAGTAAAQLGAAIGTPLLRPLGQFTGMLAKLVGGAAGIADTKVGGAALSTVAYGGIAAIAARRLFGAGLGGAALRQGLTSGPVLSGIAAYRTARGTPVTTDRFGRERLGRFLGGPAAAIQRSQEDGTLGEGRMGGVNQRIYGFASGFGRARQEAAENRYQNRSMAVSQRFGAFSPEASAWREANEPGAPRGSLAGRAFRGVRTVGLVGAAAYNSVNAAQFAAANTPAGPERDAAVNRRLSFLGGGVGRAARDVGGIVGGEEQQRRTAAGLRGLQGPMTEEQSTRQLGSRSQQLADRFRQMSTEINNTNRAFPNLTRALSSMGRLTTDAARSSVGAGVGTLGLAARGGRGLLGAMGGAWGLGITGGIMAGSYWMQQRSANKEYTRNEIDRQNNASPTDAIDKYNESMGRATSSTSSYADAVQTATRQINNAVSDVGTATTVRPQDVQAAQANPKPITTFSSSATNDQIASQIRLMSPSGMDPTQLNSIKVDLLRNHLPQDRVSQILSGLTATGGGTNQTPALSGAQDLRNVVAQAGAEAPNVTHGRDRIENQKGYYSSVSRGLGFSQVRLKGDQQQAVDTASGSISQRYSNQQDMFGGGFAQQTRLQDINAAMDEAQKSGNEAVVDQLGDQLARQQLGVQKIPKITSSDIRKYGGYVQALAAKDPKGFGQQLATMQAPTGQGGQGISLTPGQGLPATMQRSNLANQMQQFGAIAPYFDNTLQMPRGQGVGIYAPGNGPQSVQNYGAQQKMQDSLMHPDDLQKASSAVEAMVDASTKAGHSLTDLSTESGKAAAKIGDSTSPAYQRLLATQDEAQFRQRGMAPFQTSGQNIAQNMQTHSGMAQMEGNTPEVQQRRQQGREGLQDDMQQFTDQLKQRIMAERQYQIQRGRATEDYNKQVAYANQDFQRSQLYAQQDFQTQRQRSQEDFQRQSARSNRDYQRQQQRATEDYQTSVARAYQDFYTQRQREERDFQISMQRGQDDYLTQRGRAIRDFNKQLGRQIEDQAKGLYDPYTRIQTQAVWDAKQLMANLGDQTAAIQKQKAQLDQVRKMGLSNDTIQSLGLNDPKNAQQLNQLVNNFLADPKLAKELNATAAQRLSMSKLLVTDPSNKDLQRARDDFNQQLADMETDYQKSVARARADMSKQLADQEADFGRTLSRMSSDFNRAMARSAQDFHTAMSDAADDFSRAMTRQDQDYQRSVSRSLATFQVQMDRMRDQYNVALTRMRQDVTESEKEIAGNLFELWDAVTDATQGKTAGMNKVMKDGLQDTINFIKDKRNLDQINAAYKDLLPYDLTKLTGGGGGGGGGGPAGLQPGFSVTSGGGLDTGYKGIEEAVAKLGFRFGPPSLGQTYGGGHAGNSEHYQQRAVDFGSATSNPGAIGRALVRYAIGPFSPIDELIYSPLGIGYKNGTNIGEAGYGAATWAAHRDHLHVGVRPGVSLAAAVAAGPGAYLFSQLGFGGNGGMIDNHDGKALGPWGAYLQVYQALQEMQAESAGGGGVPIGAPQSGPLIQYAKTLLNKYGWGNQWNDFNALEMSEAGWNVHARNPSSGAYGLAQALPPGKYASAGADWRDNGYTQLNWMMDYIAHSGNFHDPHSAWAFHRAHNWYGDGGIFSGAQTIGVGERGREAVVPLDHNGVETLAGAFRAAIHPEQLQAMMVGGHQSPISYVSQVHTEDNSTYIDTVKVESQDPNDMLNKVNSKKTTAALTGNGKRR